MVRWNAYKRRGDSFVFVAYVSHNQNVAMKASGSLSLLVFFFVLTILLVPEAMVWAGNEPILIHFNLICSLFAAKIVI